MSNPRIPYRLSSQGPKLPPLKGKRILVHLVVNVENWQFDQPMPRTIITPPHGKETVPDVPNFSWADYGMRAGLPRILEAFDKRGLPASTSCNAGVIDAYPQAAEAMASSREERQTGSESAERRSARSMCCIVMKLTTVFNNGECRSLGDQPRALAAK